MVAPFQPAGGAGAHERAMQMAAFAAAEVLTAGLEMAGRALSREALVRALERLRDSPTGVLPPITYDRVRRQGARGALIIERDESGRIRPPRWQESLLLARPGIRARPDVPGRARSTSPRAPS